MNADFVNLTTENLNDEHLCCIIRSKSLMRVLTLSGDGFPTDSMKAMFLESSMQRLRFL